MSENTTTPFSSQTEILSELWINYRADEQFRDFLEYNDLGLPLAYAIQNKIVEPTPIAQGFIEETFSLFLAGLDIQDTGFDNLDELLAGNLE